MFAKGIWSVTYILYIKTSFDHWLSSGYKSILNNQKQLKNYERIHKVDYNRKQINKLWVNDIK